MLMLFPIFHRATITPFSAALRCCLRHAAIYALSDAAAITLMLYALPRHYFRRRHFLLR